MYASLFTEPDQLSTQLHAAIGASINLALPIRPLDWANTVDAQLMRSCHARLNTGIAAIPELRRLLERELTDCLVFMAVATGSATIAQLAELLESDEITTGDHLHREESRRLDVLDQRLADIPAEQVTTLRLIASGLALDNLPEPERAELDAKLEVLTTTVRQRLATGDAGAVPALLAQRWITPWRPSILLNLDRQIWALTHLPPQDQ